MATGRLVLENIWVNRDGCVDAVPKARAVRVEILRFVRRLSRVDNEQHGLLEAERFPAKATHN